MRGRRVHFSQNTKAYTGRGSKPRMSRRRALPAHFLATEGDQMVDGAPPSTAYTGAVDEYEEYENFGEELPEIAYFWD
jgi:hypothetical protein